MCEIQSKALEKSMATVVVWAGGGGGGGQLWLKPSAMVEAKGRRAEVVE